MMYYLRRAIVAIILLGVVFYHSAGLMRLLERALSAPPYQQAAGIIVSAVIVLLGSIVWNCAAMVVAKDRGAPTAYTVAPMGVARLARPGTGTTSDLERWAEIHKHDGESTKDAVKRLEPLWNQRELSEDVSITQRRRHEAAHVVVAWAQGGTVLSVNTHRRLDRDGHYKELIPLPHPGAAKVSWYRTQVYLAGLAQDVLDGCEAHGSGTDIDSALRAAVVLVAMGWRPDGYTGPLNPGDLIAYAIETDKQLLADRQDAIAAIEKALIDKDELTGVEVHSILGNLRSSALESADEVAR